MMIYSTNRKYPRRVPATVDSDRRVVRVNRALGRFMRPMIECAQKLNLSQEMGGRSKIAGLRLYRNKASTFS